LTLTSPTAVEDRWTKAEEARDEAVKKLLTPQQVPVYEKIAEQHRQIAKAFAKDLSEKQRIAEEQTRALLTPRQQEEFDKLVKRGSGRAGGASTVPSGVPVSDLRADPERTPKDATHSVK
jgi:hypothetical protein